MHVHILGIGGTFMAGVAALAHEAGHRVSGADTALYPPMSTQLEALGIAVNEGYDPAQLEPAPDCTVVGNALSRGNPAVETLLDRDLPFTSGPQWLAEHVLAGRWVLAVAGTHGKTTTATMLAWILHDAGLDPGFLIGGIPDDFPVSARLGTGRHFVVEADEYDTAFFDKRAKFVHYRPRTAVLNNLEYDHADIYPDLGAIERQFHHLVRTVPGRGRIISPAGDANLTAALALGCWTPVEHFAVERGDVRWQGWLHAPDASRFMVHCDSEPVGEVNWALVGRHNVHNALAAVAAAEHAGVAPAAACAALSRFSGVKRRLEQVATVDGVTVYDDFAHHPTAIATTLEGLRGRTGNGRLIAVLEPRSATMRLGVHQGTLGPALASADAVVLYRPPALGWDLTPVAEATGRPASVLDTVEAVIERLCQLARPGDHIVIMSNGGFEGLPRRLPEALAQRAAQPEGE